MGGSAARVGAEGRDSSGLSKACLRAEPAVTLPQRTWYATSPQKGSKANDDVICIDGVEKYTFVDADAGDLPVNERSDDDDDHDDDEEEEQEEQDEEEQWHAGGVPWTVGRQRY